jgi:hypothetical protein
MMTRTIRRVLGVSALAVVVSTGFVGVGARLSAASSFNFVQGVTGRPSTGPGRQR